MDIFNFLMDRATRRQINEILGLPRFTRADLLRHAEPRLDSNTLSNWTRRGDLDLEYQAVIGTADEIRTLIADWQANENLGSRRRYTGGDILKVMTLNAISQAGLPFNLAQDIIRIVLERAGAVLMAPPGGHQVVLVLVDREGKYKVRAGDLSIVSNGSLRETDGVGEWFTVIDVDMMVARFLRPLVEDSDSE